MIDFLHYIFKYWVHDFGFVATALFIALWKQLNKLEKWIGVLVMWIFTVDLVAASIAYKSIPNQWFYNLSFPFQIALILFIFHQLFSSIRVKKQLVLGYFIYIVLYVSDLLFLQKMDQLNTYVYIPACISIAAVAYFYLRTVVNNPDAVTWNDFSFWFASAMLINCTATVPLITLLTWSGISDPVWNKIYYLNNFIDCFWFSFLSIGILWIKRQTLFSL